MLNAKVVGGCCVGVIGVGLYLWLAPPAWLVGNRDLDNCLAELAATYELPATDQLAIEREHLNRDNHKDAIVTISTPEHCGSTGCIKEVCMSDETTGTFTPATVGFAADTVTVTGARTEGVADLLLHSRNSSLTLVWQQGRYVIQ